MLTMLKELCDLYGVASFEDDVRSYIQTKASSCAGGLRVDAMGNLIVFKQGAQRGQNKLLLTAHMDEAGLIIRDITDEGYLKFAPVGPLDARVVIGKKVSVGWSRVPGVVGLKAYHLVSEEEEKVVPKLSDMYIDIGARSREEAEALVSRGDYAAFATRAEEFGAGLLKAKALDSRIGCAVLLQLLEEDLPMDCTFAFTVQEGVGARGAFGAAFPVAPDIALTVEGASAADIPGSDAPRGSVKLGKGPVLAAMDGGTVYDRALFELIRSTAEKDGTPWQLRPPVTALNDASAVQRTREGVRVAAIAAPVRYARTPSGLVSVTDYEQTCALVRKSVEAIAAL